MTAWDNAQLLDAIATAQSSLLAAFNPDDSVRPPLGGGSKICRVVQGRSVALELWDAHAVGTQCKQPFLWVRVRRQFRSQKFPSPIIDITPCTLPLVAELEVGVGRCTMITETVNWDQQAK